MGSAPSWLSWWAGAGGFERLYWCLAIPATLGLLYFLAASFVFGLEHDGGADTGGDGDASVGHFQLLTVRNVAAFFAMAGWSGLALIHSGFGKAAVLGGSFVVGLFTMFVMAALMMAMARLACSGTMDQAAALGCPGTVYVPVPARREGPGRVNVLMCGKTVEMEAVCDDAEALPVGASVRVKEIGGNRIIVERTA